MTYKLFQRRDLAFDIILVARHVDCALDPVGGFVGRVNTVFLEICWRFPKDEQHDLSTRLAKRVWNRKSRDCLHSFFAFRIKFD